MFNGRPNFYWHEYYLWMLRLIQADSGEKANYQLLLAVLDAIPFRWSVANDDNRSIDGIDLRRKFAYENYIDLTDEDMSVDCSVLEMMVALSLRCDSDITGEPEVPHPETLFWEMISNLDLDRFTNDSTWKGEEVKELIDIWLDRRFRYDGSGSPFPIDNPSCDQRKLEIWGQLNEYLIENYDN